MRGIAEIDRILKDATDRAAVPGVVAMAATPHGPVYQGAFGRRALPDGAAMTADSVFWIASMTKAITSTAAMQLVEEEKLALDKPIAEVLPELAAPQVLEGFNASGKPRLRPAQRPITLRHLITHTAGFVYGIWNADIARYLEQTGTPEITTCRSGALALPLVFDPGEKWDYGISIAQNAIGDLIVQPLKTVAPALSNDAEFFPGMAKKWGSRLHDLEQPDTGCTRRQ